VEDAIAAYEAGSTQVPDALGLQLALGELYLRQGRAADAEVLYDTLTASTPTAVDAFVGLAKAHIAQAEDMKALRFEWANTALQRALRLDPESVPALSTLGDLMQAYGRPAEAAQAYESALSYRTSLEEDTTLRTKLADAYATANQWERALQEYQRVAIANPTSIGAQMTLGNAYRQVGRAELALAQFRRINGFAPGYPFAYIKQGEILDELEQADAALAAYEAAVKAAPDNADALFTLGSAYRKRDRTQEAIQALQAGLAIDPTREGPLRALSELQAGGADTQ
jgi:tetratricopeptide (TPR) repeat protein